MNLNYETEVSHMNDMNELKELAQRISGLREACGYTQEELAAELNLDAAVYREY